MVSGFYNQQPARRSLTPTSAALQVSLGKLLNPWKVKSHVGSMDTKSQEAWRGAELEFVLPSRHPAPGPLEHPLPHGLQAGARPQASCHAEGQQVPPSAATHDCGKILLFMCFESSLAIKLFFASPYVQFWQALVPVCQIPVRRINLQPLQLRSPQSSSPSPASHLLKPEAPSRASGRAEPCLEENQGQFNKQRWKLFENVVTQMTIANINICGEVLLYLPSWKSERIAWTV